MSAAQSTVLNEDVRAAVLDAEAGDDEAAHCLVCYSELTHIALTPCNHNEICATCHLRIRFLEKDMKCPICKAGNEQLIVDSRIDRKPLFSDYPLWGDDLGSNFFYRRDVGMFFPTRYYETEIEPLFGYHCTFPKCKYKGLTLEPEPAAKADDEVDEFDNDRELQQQQQSTKKHNRRTPLRALQDHLRVKHRATLCQLCVDHNRDFVARLPRFTPTQLKKHLKEGDGPGSGFNGHPMCKFCAPTRFYDVTHLHQHLLKDHYKCHLCDQAGLQNQFFRDYKHLERHFDRKHFLCHNPQCLQARFIVFSNEIDLRHHERTVHGATSTNAKIQLEFKVRRTGTEGLDSNQQAPTEQDFNFGLDGEAFVPDDLPRGVRPAANDRSNDSAFGGGRSSEHLLHPLHVQRTAQLRERAAEMQAATRAANEPEAFPRLNSAEDLAAVAAEEADTNTNFRVGWTSGSGTMQRIAMKKKNAGQVTAEDFPSLPTTSRPKVSNTRLRAGLGSSGRTNQRQISARPAASQSSVAAASWGGTSSARHTAVDHASVQKFPSLGGSARAVNRTINRKANLTADNFPSLGPAPTRAASGDLAKRIKSGAEKATPQQYQKPKAPPLNSQTDFPAPPTSSTAGYANVRQRLLNQPKASTIPVNENVSVDDMKTSMGTIRYKQLKNLTKQFALAQIAPSAYVDEAATLFDQGTADSDFWDFLPALVTSSPNPEASEEGLRYMETLRNPPRKPTGSVPKSKFVVPGKKKNAWGGTGGASTVVRNSKAGAAAAAAANAKPVQGTATKYMAKQNKLQKQQQQQAAGGKKKKKQKDELRQLAFGK